MNQSALFVIPVLTTSKTTVRRSWWWYLQKKKKKECDSNDQPVCTIIRNCRVGSSAANWKPWVVFVENVTLIYLHRIMLGAADAARCGPIGWKMKEEKIWKFTMEGRQTDCRESTQWQLCVSNDLKSTNNLIWFLRHLFHIFSCLVFLALWCWFLAL